MEASRRAKTEKGTSSSVKCEGFAHCFLRYNGVVHYKFLAQGRVVNKEYYFDVMRWLPEAIRQKRTELWKISMDIAQEILTTFNDVSDLFKKVITGDESWVSVYDIEIKGQLSHGSIQKS